MINQSFGPYLFQTGLRWLLLLKTLIGPAKDHAVTRTGGVHQTWGLGCMGPPPETAAGTGAAVPGGNVRKKVQRLQESPGCKVGRGIRFWRPSASLQGDGALSGQGGAGVARVPPPASLATARHVKVCSIIGGYLWPRHQAAGQPDTHPPGSGCSPAAVAQGTSPRLSAPCPVQPQGEDGNSNALSPPGRQHPSPRVTTQLSREGHQRPVPSVSRSPEVERRGKVSYGGNLEEIGVQRLFWNVAGQIRVVVEGL